MLWRRLGRALMVAAAVTVAAVQAKPMENGQSIVGRDGVIIDCRTSHDAYFADPDDCTMFYHCSDWAGLEHKSCGALYFHPQKNVCDWPYIVRRVRHDCPNADPEPFEIEELTSSEEAEEVAKAFDDGGYVRFEPDPGVRFRFPTEPPAPPRSKLALKVIDDVAATTARTTVRNDPTIKLRLPDQPRVPRGRRPTAAPSTATLLRQQKKKAAIASIKRRKPNKQRVKDVEEERLIVKSLPSRDIVKSLPSKPRRPLPGREPAQQVVPSRSPVRQVPRKQQQVLPSVPTTTLTLNDRSPLRLAVVGDSDEDLDSAEKLKIRLLLEQAKVDEEDETTVLPEDIPISEESSTESLTTSTPEASTTPKTTLSPFKKVEERPEFLQVLKKKAQKFKEKLEEEEAKKEEEVEEEVDEIKKKLKQLKLTTPSTTTTEEATSASTTSTEASRLKLTITKVVSTSEVLGDEDEDDDETVKKVVITTEKSVSSSAALPTTSTSTTPTSEEEEEVASTTNSNLRIGIKPPSLRLPLTTTSTTPKTTSSSTEATTTSMEDETTTEVEDLSVEEDEEEGEKVLIIKPSQFSNDLLTGQGNDGDENEDENPVHVVVAVSAPRSSNPNAQPLVSADSLEEVTLDGGDESVNSNAVQESRIHTTVAEADNGDGAIKREIATEKTNGQNVLDNQPDNIPSEVTSGYDFVVRLLDHFDLNSVMHYLAGEEVDKAEDLVQEVTTVKTTEAAKTMPKTSPTTSTTTTTKETTKSSPSTTTMKKDRPATTERGPKGSDTVPATTTSDVEDETTPLTSVRNTESIQVVLPVGYASTTPYPTFPSKNKSKKKYVTIDRGTGGVTVTTTEEPVAKPTRKPYVDIVRTTTYNPEEEETTPKPTRKPYVVIDRSSSPPVISTSTTTEKEELVTTTTEEVETTTRARREPKIVLVGGGTIQLDEDVEEKEKTTKKPVKKVEVEKDENDGKDDKPFSRSKIRERLHSKSVRPQSTFSVLKEINSKNFAKQREEARKEALRKAFGTNGKEKDPVEDEIVAAEDLGVDASKLAERRKALFSSRFRTSGGGRNNQTTSAKKVHPIEALKAKKQQQRTTTTTTTTTTSKPPLVKSLPLRLSSRRPPPLFLRRPPASSLTATTPSSASPPSARRNFGGADSASGDNQSPSTEDKLKSLRCRLLRRPDC